MRPRMVEPSLEMVTKISPGVPSSKRPTVTKPSCSPTRNLWVRERRSAGRWRRWRTSTVISSGAARSSPRRAMPVSASPPARGERARAGGAREGGLHAHVPLGVDLVGGDEEALGRLGDVVAVAQRAAGGEVVEDVVREVSAGAGSGLEDRVDLAQAHGLGGALGGGGGAAGKSEGESGAG